MTCFLLEFAHADVRRKVIPIFVTLSKSRWQEETNMEKKELFELLKKELIIGYVYGLDAERQEYYFEKSPSNIASFIMQKRSARTR